MARGIQDYEADGELFRYAEGMANEPGEPPGYEPLRAIVGRDFCARSDPDWPRQRTECQADGGTWIEVYEGVGRPAGWFEDPYLPGWCVTAEELERWKTPAEQEMDPANVESVATQTEPSVPPAAATEPAPTELPATQPAQAQQGSPQYTG